MSGHESFEDAVRRRDADRLGALLAPQPGLRATIDGPLFDTAPAIIFCRGDRAMVDVLLEFGADINTRSQFWARMIGVLDENTPEMRADLIRRGAPPELGEFVKAVKAKDAGERPGAACEHAGMEKS